MIAYITGASSGIGKALAELLLKKNYTVIGLSRQQSIKHPNYRHVKIDLSDINQVKTFSFPTNGKDDIVLINNAGTIGPIKPIGDQTSEDIIALNNLNVTAPQLLCNQFINQYQQNNKPNYQIINISSGAAQRPIDAWATYCASKAALNLFSETVAEELTARNRTNWQIYSIAPGVVDTKMQAVIRESNPKDFLRHQDFVNLKITNELVSSTVVANKLLKIINNSFGDLPTVFSLKEIG